MFAVSFCEDDYNDVHEDESEGAFSIFCDGFEAGADAYGAGKVRLYLLPRDAAKMAEEDVGEVMRANAEIDRREATVRLEALTPPAPAPSLAR